MKEKRPRCYNCKFVGKSFKVAGLTNNHCEHPKYTEAMFLSGEISPWDTLRVFSDTCNDHEFKNLTTELTSK